jgi:hypothetical protein
LIFGVVPAVAHVLLLSDFASRLLRGREYDEADRALREAEQIVADTAVLFLLPLSVAYPPHTQPKSKELCFGGSRRRDWFYHRRS